MMEVDLIHGRCDGPQHGLSRYNHEIISHNPQIDFRSICYPGFPSNYLVDGFVKRYVFPLIVKKSKRATAILHITNQSLAFLRPKMVNRSVLTCHDLYPLLNKKWSGYWKKNVTGLKEFSKIIAISEFTKSEIIRLTGCDPDKIEVIHNGVDHARFYPNHEKKLRDNLGIPTDLKILLYVGSEEPRKNLQQLLKAFSKVIEKFPETILLKVGGKQMGGERAAFLHDISNYGLDRYVRLIDQVSEDELPQYYNIADIFLFPSRYEGFGLPVLEAMSCRVPVIASSIPPIQEIVGDAGILVKPSETNGFVKAITVFLEDRPYAMDIGSKGYQRSLLFSWEKTAFATKRVYEMMSE